MALSDFVAPVSSGVQDYVGGFVVTAEDLGTPEPEDQDNPEPYPFANAAELLQRCRESGKSIAEVMLANELTRHSEDEVRSSLLHVWAVMKECVENGCNRTEETLPGGLQARRRAPGLLRPCCHDVPVTTAARETFDRYTKGPVFVQSGSDPFLAWEDLRRSANRRSIVAYDLATRRTRELVPEGMISSYTLVEGDSVIVYNEDVTKKTDYDVIFGTENRMMARTQAGGTPRVLLPSLKSTSVVWTEDGRRAHQLAEAVETALGLHDRP